jgi:hypothetical protein
MAEKQDDKEKDKKKKKRKQEAPLPFCTTAPAAEHARGYEEEEPCDDGRSGKIGSTEEQQEATEDKGSTHYSHNN